MTNELPINGGDHQELSGELQQFAAELSQLSPRDDRLDRERLAFLAGQASVAPASAKPLKALRFRLETRAWPAAFAAMTAIAAALLALLMARPEIREAPSVVVNGHIQNDQQQLAIQLVDGLAVLTTRDVRFGDIETRLAKFDADRTAAEASVSPIGDRNPQVFTPSTWQQVIDKSEPATLLPHKSSSLSQNRGVTT